MKHGLWREVSVSGEIFGLRYSRSAKQRGKVVSDRFSECEQNNLFFRPTDFGDWSYKLTPVRLFVIPSVRNVFFGLFSKTALRIFLIFCMSVEDNRAHPLS